MEEGENPFDDPEGTLAGIRFEPRASLGPEILGRWAAGERPPAGPRRAARSSVLAVAAGLLLLAGGWIGSRLIRGQGLEITVDRCCQDLDGGGLADDGLLVVSRGGEVVRYLVVYEDRDGSGTFSAGDAVRFARQDRPSVDIRPVSGMRLIETCCLDYDGGGQHDDALLVLARPPDRVSMAAIYETGPGPTVQPLR
jgi:hypothetical protein